MKNAKLRHEYVVGNIYWANDLRNSINLKTYRMSDVEKWKNKGTKMKHCRLPPTRYSDIKFPEKYHKAGKDFFPELSLGRQQRA